MQIKTRKKYYFTYACYTIFLKFDAINIRKDVNPQYLLNIADGALNWWNHLRKQNYDPESLPLDIYLKEMLTHAHPETYIRIFIAAAFKILKTWK